MESFSSNPPSSSSLSASHVPAEGKDAKRLYVGNLHPSVDEYILVRTFSQYGKIAKLDFLFHKSGPMKGKPRGYAFVEYNTKGEALHAMNSTNNHTLRGRKLAVTFANFSHHVDSASMAGTGPHRRQPDPTRPTTLSLIKNARKPESTDAKIAAMEAKLASLHKHENTNNAPNGGGSSSRTNMKKSSFNRSAAS